MEIEVHTPFNQHTDEPVSNFRYVKINTDQGYVNLLIGIRGATHPPTRFLYEASIILTFNKGIINFNIDKNRFGPTFNGLIYPEAFTIVTRSILNELSLTFGQWLRMREIIEEIIFELDRETWTKNNFSHKFNIKKLKLNCDSLLTN